MYSQLIYFIIALLLFTIQQPGSEPYHSPLFTFLVGTGMFAAFVFVCRTAFLKLLRAAEEYPAIQGAVSLRYHQVQGRLSILALVILAGYVYGLNIKYYLKFVPGFETYLTSTGFIGIMLYLLLLMVVWYWSYPVYRRLHGSAMTRWSFLRSHIGFQLALLVPWLFISLVSDILQFFPLPVFFSSELGQAFTSGVILIFFLLLAPWLVVRLWRCEPLPPIPARIELEEFCRTHHFKVGDFMLWPLLGGEMLTAGVMGLLPRIRYILLTRGIINLLSIDELKAVVAHEMGHVRRYHLLFYMLFFLAYSVMVYSIQDTLLLFLFRQSPLLQWAMSPTTFHLTIFSLIYTLPILILMVVYFRFVFGFFMRNSERQADLFALRLIGHPFTLVSSLEKIAFHSGHIEDLPSWHHFSISERIRFLKQCYEDPSLIRRHDWKLYGSAVALFTAIAIFSTMGFYFQQSSTVHAWRTELQLSILEQELRLEPDDPELRAAYGGLLLEKQRYAEAEIIMRKALETAPDNPGILNNLAWLYATSPPPQFDARAALDLASRAAALKPDSPQILDTLAEAYFVNGRFGEALETIDRAIALKPERMAYFLEQKKKFEDSLKNVDQRSDLNGDNAIDAYARRSIDGHLISFPVPH